MDFRDTVFGAGERVMVDGNRFFGCTFDEGCIVEFSALDRQYFEHCKFHVGADYQFTDAAGRTLDFMRFFVASGMGPLAEAWIDGRSGRVFT